MAIDDFDNFELNDKEVIKVADLQEWTVQCADCKEPLLQFLRIRDDHKEQKVIIECPFCGGSSWRTDLKGQWFQACLPDIIIDDMIEEDDGLIRITMKGIDDD
tara:strand:+ start:1639 stop:1947 length:309 start_codon:yes stop_codon:yes gene_type:complete